MYEIIISNRIFEIKGFDIKNVLVKKKEQHVNAVLDFYHLFSTYSQKAKRSLISIFVPSSSVTSPFQIP